MKDLIEITGNDISLLHDDDLRSLIGRLCEADYRSMGLSTKGITWGGHQDASDGGLDVVVGGDALPPSNSYIPRENSGFQVKKSKMPAGEIVKEMKPNGVLRAGIKSLIECGGAYVIVSSGDSTTDTMLKDRIDAMRHAVKDEDGHENLKVEFYDCGQIATWLRAHPSLILWVRNKIERPLRGWRSFENWARTPGGVEEEYLLDDGLRIYDESSDTHPTRMISIKDGISKFRLLLSSAGNCLRLVGLSGVGKTRFVQTLFDSRIGENSLNLSQVFYTDISDNPEPDPLFMAEQLNLNRAKGVLIIDNCHPDLHRRLTKVCSEPKSTISLLTIEYDVRDDLPEETSIFRLEPSSEETIEQIVKIHFPYINHFDARTIAHFSGGNARIAIALASTVQKGETLSGFRDEELFKRLFMQRNDSNESLLISAQILSIVYSFDGVDVESDMSELRLLASLNEKSVFELYRHIDEIAKRGLIQSRNIWRAVLPPAIANRLAKLALGAIPKNKIVQTILSGSERLIKSFTRRLGYLHDDKNSISIVDDLLAPQGLLGKENCKFSPFGIQIFKNIAPVAPEKTLMAIEHAANIEGAIFTSRENPHYYEIVSILWHLAYDEKLFDRCAKLMSRFALSERPEENQNSIRKLFKSLFYIHYSGTHATVESREKIILELLESKDENEKELGLVLLDTTLETMYFSSIHNFEFGARPRDSGYRPKSQSEVAYWYGKFIAICTKLALSKELTSNKARNILSKNFRGLCIRGQMFDILEKSAIQIHEDRVWNEGWFSIRETIQNDNKILSEETLEKIQSLEKRLRPVDLIELARASIFSPSHRGFTTEDDYSSPKDISCVLERAKEATCKIGIQVAGDANTLEILLPDLFSSKANIRLFSFGEGLAEGSVDKYQVWQILHSYLSQLSPDHNKRVDVLIGFLSVCAKQDRALFNSFIDDAVDNAHLIKWLPILESSSTLDQESLRRLNKALDSDEVEINHFTRIGYGRTHESISDDDLAILLNKMLSKRGGTEVVIEILKMRFFKEKDQDSIHSKSLIEVSRTALVNYPFSAKNRHDNVDHDLGHIADVCLHGGDGKSPAIALCLNFIKACMDRHILAMDYHCLLVSIASAQPFVFLDFFIKDEIINNYHCLHIFFTNGNPLDKISEEELINWCDLDPSMRYPKIASVLNVFIEADNQKNELRLNTKLLAIINKAPKLSDIFEKLSNSIWGGSGWGTRADFLQRKLNCLMDLCMHKNLEVSLCAKKLCASITNVINQERGTELQSSHQYESFE